METIKLNSLDHLNEVTAAHSNVLLIVSKNACAGCDNLKRALEHSALLQAALVGVTVVQAQMETVRNIVTSFGLRMAPTMILFKDDEEVARKAGFESPDALIEALQQAFQPLAQAA